MTENTQWRFPSDRVKLHAMLQKKNAVLAALTAEVEELRRRTTEADHLAITNIADEFSVTPDQFMRFVQAMQNGLVSDDLMALIMTDPAPAPDEPKPSRVRKQSTSTEEITHDDK